MPKSYPYACAKIRALEPSILDQTDIERMIDAPDFETAFKVLNDTDYGDNLVGVLPLNYRDALRADFKQLYELLAEITPDRRLFKIMYYGRDYLVARYYLKAKHFDIDESEFLGDIEGQSVHTVQQIKQFIIEGSNDNLEPEFAQSVTQAINTLSAQPSPADIDSALGQAYLLTRLTLARQMGNAFIINLAVIHINCANYLTCLRAQRLGLTVDELRPKLIDTQGCIPIRDLLTYYEEQPVAYKEIAQRFFDAETVARFDEFIEKKSLYIMEKALDDYLTRYAQQAKRIAYGPEVIASYYIAKRIAVQNLRVIMAGKLNNIASEEIKKTLRLTY